MMDEEKIPYPKGKHKKFADLYLKYMNATRAYMEVYPGATRESAWRLSSNLMRNVEVAAYIQDKMKEFQMDAETALRLQSDIANGDMADFMDPGTLMLDLRKAYEAGQTKLIKKLKQRTITKLGKNDSDEDIEIHDLEIELYPADNAIRDVLKVHGRYKADELPPGTVITVTIGRNADEAK